MKPRVAIRWIILALVAWAKPAYSDPTPWTLTAEGLYGNMSFSTDQSASSLELRHEDERRRSVWGRYLHARKFQMNADLLALGSAFPIPVPRSALAFELAVAPHQTIVPETSADLSFIHDPTGWLEVILRYKFSHYPVNNVHLVNPTFVWMPTEKVQLSAGYHFTETQFLGNATAAADHSISTRLLIRPCSWVHPWIAYSHSEESFEAGDSSVGKFKAHHYVGGMNLMVWKNLEFRSSFELEERNNHQIVRTGTLATTYRW